MRALVGLLVIASVALAPPAARASGPLCDFSSPPDATVQTQIAPYLAPVAAAGGTVPRGGEAGDAARAVLGGQFVQIWLDNARHGWSVAFSPGPLDTTSARQAIRDALATRLTPAEVEFLDSTLNLFSVPYSYGELKGIQDQFASLMRTTPIFSIASMNCMRSDAFRVEVGVADPETPELRAQAEAIVAPFGDRVVVYYGAGRSTTLGGWSPVPVPVPAPAAVRVAEHVSVPRASRCLHAPSIGVKAARDVKSVVVKAGARRLTLKAGRRGALKLTRRLNRVTITVTLKDGRRATRTLTYRRC